MSTVATISYRTVVLHAVFGLLALQLSCVSAKRTLPKSAILTSDVGKASPNATPEHINKLTNATSQHKADLTAFGLSKDSMLAEAEIITGRTASEHDRDNPETTPEPTYVIQPWSAFFEQHKQGCIITACVAFWLISLTTWASWGLECQSQFVDKWAPAVYDGKGIYALFALKYLAFVIVFFPVYFWHAYWDWPKCSAEEPTVRNHLRSKKHIFADSVISMICYRRNMMLMSFLFAFLLILLQIEDFCNTYREMNEYDEWEAEIRPLNYSKFAEEAELNPTDPETFKAFTLHSLAAMGKESMKTTTAWNQIGNGIGAAVATLTTLYLGHALNYWDEFLPHATQKAWFISIFGPFLTTVVPLKNFVNTEGIRAMALEYDGELQKFSNQAAEHYAQQALQACEQLSTLRSSGFLDYGVDTMHSVCGSIRKYTPNKHLKCCKPLFNIIDAPFDSMHSTCGKVDEYLAEGNVDQAKYALKVAEEDICMVMAPDLKSMAAGEKKNAMSQILQNNVVANLLEHISIYETAVTTGLMCFQTIVVPALAIAAGFLRAAWAIKLIVPQSSLPGFLILMLPWLFVPFTWGIYSLIYQLELSGTDGQQVFHAGLIICAISGFGQTLGGLWVEIQKPMSDVQAEDAYCKLSYGVLGIYTIGLGCILYYAVVWIKTNADIYFASTDTFDLLALLSQYYFARPVTIFRQAVSYFNDFFLTQQAATDWLASSITQQWAYDMEEEQLGKKPPPEPPISRLDSSSEEQNEEEVTATDELPETIAIKNAISRVERLDCLIWVSENSMEKVVKDTESGSKVLIRQTYVPEGGAYQYSSDGYANEAKNARSRQGEGDGGPGSSRFAPMGEGDSRISAPSGSGAYGQYQQSGDGYGQYQQSGAGYGAYGQYQQSGGGYHDPYAQPAGPGQYQQPQFPYDSSTQYQQ